MSGVKFNLNLKDFHQAHLSRKHLPADTATYPEYRTIIEAMGEILGDELVSKGKVHLPTSTWLFKIIKTKNVYVNKQESKKAQERIVAFNDHSDGFACRILLSINEGQNKQKSLYKFKATRKLARLKLNATIRKNKSIIYNYETIVKKEYVK